MGGNGFPPDLDWIRLLAIQEIIYERTLESFQ